MSAEKALEQIKTREYFSKYELDQRPLTMIGVSFNGETGEISQYKQ